MKFKTSSSTLLNVLQNTAKVIAAKQTMPILSNFLFTLKDGKLNITATDLESTIIADLEVDSSDEDGVAAVPSTTILEVLRELGDQPISVSIDEESFEINIKWLSGEIALAGANGMAYPEISDSTIANSSTIELSCEQMLTGINQTVFAASSSDTRPTLSGVLMDIYPEQIVFVATDAHKLVKMSIDVNMGVEERTMVIIPKKTAQLLKNILVKNSDIISIEFSKSDIKFTTNGYTYMSRVIEGNYPNYNSVIPKNNPNKVIIDRAEFLSSLKRVSVCTSKGTDLVKLIIEDGTIVLEARDVDFYTSGEDKVSCSFTGEERVAIIGVKSKNITDMLSSLSCKDISIKFWDTASTTPQF